MSPGREQPILRALAQRAGGIRPHGRGTWGFELTNGHRVLGTATCCDEWLDLRVPLAATDDEEFPWVLLAENGALRGPARFERYDSRRMGIAVQTPIGDRDIESRVQLALDAMLEATHLRHGKVEPPSRRAAEPSSTEWLAAASEQGLRVTPRDDGNLTVELDAPGLMNQALLEPDERGALVSLAVLRTGSLTPACRRAIGAFALALAAGLRLVRASITRDEAPSLRFEVVVPGPGPRNLGLAVEALSAAARNGSREIRALSHEPLAGTYLAHLGKE